MKRIVWLSLLLSGCATISQKQSECESKYQKFADIYQCTKENTQSDPRAKTHQGYKLYMLKGEQLAEEVNQGKMTDLDAKVQWQELYLAIENNETANIQRAMDSYNANRPKTTTCVPVGNSVSCNTQ